MHNKIVTLLTAVVLGISAPAWAVKEKVVHVYNWSDYIGKDTLARFEQATGIKAIYDVYDSNETLEAKLMAGKSGYDVVFPSAHPFAQRQVAAGLYRTLDKTKLPNYRNLDPAILKALEEVDPGNQHVVPYMWGTTGIGINRDRKKPLGSSLPHHRTYGSRIRRFDELNSYRGARLGSPIVLKKRRDSAIVSAGVFDSRHGPWTDLRVFHASRTVTPRLRSSR